MALTLIKTSPALGYSPRGLAFDGKYFYMGDSVGQVIKKYDKDFTLIRTSAALGYGSYGLASDGKYLYVVDSVGQVVKKYVWN